MPETEIHMLDFIQKMNVRPEEASFGQRRDELETKKRINTLFGKSTQDDQSKGSPLSKDGYETVNEGQTTDTTEIDDSK